jgi:hypothetical protein
LAALIVERGKAFASSRVGKSDIAPHAATWLNNRRWEEDDSVWSNDYGKGKKKDYGAYDPTIESGQV